MTDSAGSHPLGILLKDGPRHTTWLSLRHTAWLSLRHTAWLSLRHTAWLSLRHTAWLSLRHTTWLSLRHTAWLSLRHTTWLSLRHTAWLSLRHTTWLSLRHTTWLSLRHTTWLSLRHTTWLSLRHTAWLSLPSDRVKYPDVSHQSSHTAHETVQRAVDPSTRQSGRPQAHTRLGTPSLCPSERLDRQDLMWRMTSTEVTPQPVETGGQC
ncbi:hypothetical protein ACOMHN_019228 [Nucella lapillus]